MTSKFTSVVTGAVKLSHCVFKPSTTTPLSLQPPLLVIHGLFGSKRNWESVAKAFSRAGLEIITIDARNHGDSPHVSQMDYHSMSTDVVGLINDIGLDRVNLLGHSMGGKIAMTLALTQPHLVNKLIIEDIAPCVSISTGIAEAAAAMKNVSLDDKSLTSISLARKFANNQLLASFPDTATRNFILTNIVQKGERFEWRINLDTIESEIQHILGFPHFDTQFDGKCLFLGGNRSLQISKPVYGDIYRLFPKAIIQHIDGAGHWVHAEKPYQFMAAVESFLASSSDTGS